MIYQCLAEDTREIRLLKLLPNEDFNAKVECLIYKVSLQSGPSYVALSYAWGDPEIKAGILVNGTELMVTTNLESGLRQIRQSYNESSFWIDAICIDQTNVNERTHQVRLMREIYSNVEVLVWLGTKSDDSDVAMNALAYWLFRYVQRDNKRSIIPHVVGSLNPQEWQALQKLIERPWWTRLWCLQELVLAKEVLVLCGSKLLPWDCFFILQMIVEGIQKSSYGKLGYQGRVIVDPRDFGMLDEKVAIRLNQLPPNGKRDSLLSLLYVSQALENSEPLDKVYALLGIAGDSSDFDSPDYTRSTSTVYTNVARTIIQRDHDLAVIASGGIVQSTRDMGGNNIPSWVPDWSQGNNKWQFSLVLWSYCAAKDTTAISWFISAPKATLFAKGIIYDGITSVEKPIRDTLIGLKVVESVECLVQRILLAVGGPGSYVTGIPRLQAFFRATLLDQDPIENTCLTSRSIFSFEMACGFIGFILSAFQSRPAPSWLDEFMKKRTHYDRLEVLLGASDSQNINKAFVVPSQFDSFNCYADHLPAFIRRYSTVSVAQCLVSTKKGYLGIAEQSVRPGDFIGVFLGCKVPVILRGISGQYQVVGGCFVIGLMQGEVMDELGGESVSLQDIELY